LDDERVRKEKDEKKSIAGKDGYRNWRFVVFRNIKARQAKEELIEHGSMVNNPRQTLKETTHLEPTVPRT